MASRLRRRCATGLAPCLAALLALSLPGASLAAAAVASSQPLPPAATGTPHRVFIAGDSTASVYPAARMPRTGWGQVLQAYLATPGWTVVDLAQSGRSARSFIEQGWLADIDAGLQPGDVLLIQFGHNDEKLEDPARYNEPLSAYPAWLLRYVQLARDRGATPILLTPLARRTFDHAQLLDTHGLYPQSMRDLARREHVPLIDVTASSMAWLRSLGNDASKAFYMHVPAQGQADDTHLQRAGALQVACQVARGWQALMPDRAISGQRVGECAGRDVPTHLNSGGAGD